MILLDFECSIGTLTKIVESQGGFFKKSTDTVESLALSFFNECREFCELNFDGGLQCNLAYAESSIDASIRNIDNDPLNIIELKDTASALGQRIVQDWLAKHKNNSSMSPRFLCVLTTWSDIDRVIESLLATTDFLKGSVYVSLRQGDEVKVSMVDYPNFRLNGAILGGIEFNYRLSEVSKETQSQLESVSFFERSDERSQTESKKSLDRTQTESDARRDVPTETLSTPPPVSDEFILQSVTKPVNAIKVLRNYFGLGLLEAKNIVDNCPCALPTNKEISPQLISDLKAVGCKLESRSKGGRPDTDAKLDNVRTILAVDIDTYTLRHELEGESRARVIRHLLGNLGLEIYNSLSVGDEPNVIVYADQGVTITCFKDVQEFSDNLLEKYLGSRQSVNFALPELTSHDWESALIYMSGDADARVLAIGYHPSFDEPVRQIYWAGELDTGIVEDRDIDLYGSNYVAELFDEMLR